MTDSPSFDLPGQAHPAPRSPAHIIRSDAEAIEVAQRLAEDFAREAALLTQRRLLGDHYLNGAALADGQGDGLAR